MSICLGIALCSTISEARKVYTSNARYGADVKVCVVDYESQADLVVFKADTPQHASDENNGVWYFTNNASEADKVIFFVDKPYQADIKVFFTDSRYRAGWRDNEKKRVME